MVGGSTEGLTRQSGSAHHCEKRAKHDIHGRLNVETALFAAVISIGVALFGSQMMIWHRMGRIEVKLESGLMFLREHSHDRDTGQAIAPIPADAD